MTPNAEIAAGVAKALGCLDVQADNWTLPISGAPNGSLRKDGSNLFDPYWRARCEDWLLEHGWKVRLNPTKFHDIIELATGEARGIDCPASEFCARAIHELMKEKGDDQL